MRDAGVEEASGAATTGLSAPSAITEVPASGGTISFEGPGLPGALLPDKNAASVGGPGIRAEAAGVPTAASAM